MVVDDDDDLRSVVEMVLELAGFQAVGAQNGAVALRQLREGVNPAVILLDLRMPDLDGPGFLAQCRAQHSLNGTPVVVLSGEAGARQEANALGAADFLPKPVEMDDLVDTVRRLARP